MSYASFWKRMAAYLIDGFIYKLITFVISFAFGLALGISGAPDIIASLVGIIISVVVWVIYYNVSESSSWQATIGKKMLGLKVTDLNGQRISFWRAIGRNLGKIVSAILLCIGYLMCLWTEKRQCLHDQMAACLVLDETPNEKQGCAVAVIVVWILGVIFMVGLLTAIALPQYTRAIERARMTEAYANLQEAAAARRLYRNSHQLSATNWDQLEVSFRCTVQNNPRICVGQTFTYELTPNAITASRTGEENKYTLSIESDGAMRCDTQSEWIRSLCKHFPTR